MSKYKAAIGSCNVPKGKFLVQPDKDATVKTVDSYDNDDDEMVDTEQSLLD